MLLEMEEALEQARKNMMLEMEEALKKARKEIKKEMKNKYRGLRAPTSPDLPVATSPDLPVATSDPFTSIFCGNLPANANADQIRNIFGLHAVEGIKMPPPLANGRARGWCYVTFFYAEEAESVMDLHKTEPFSLSDDSILGKDKTREFILCVAGENVNRTQRSNLHGDLVGREED